MTSMATQPRSGVLILRRHWRRATAPTEPIGPEGILAVAKLYND
jgi:hypothetical protein